MRLSGWIFVSKVRTGKSEHRQYHVHVLDGAWDCFFRSMFCRKRHTRDFLCRAQPSVFDVLTHCARYRSARWSLIGRWTSCDRSDSECPAATSKNRYWSAEDIFHASDENVPYDVQRCSLIRVWLIWVRFCSYILGARIRLYVKTHTPQKVRQNLEVRLVPKVYTITKILMKLNAEIYHDRTYW